jgi:hypothetical protein
MQGTRLLGIGLIAAALLAIGVAPLQARSDATFPPEVLDPELFPGMRGIPELEGDNVHNCGNLLLHVTNFGLLGSRPGTRNRFASAPSAQWPAGTSTEYLWDGGLWLGAIKAGEPRVTTATPQVEFWPGRSEQDIIYQTRELAPGGARLPAPNADDDGDRLTDEDWLDGRDNDGDGRIDEDFAAISNQMFFCEFWDTDPSRRLSLPEHEPLGCRVQQATLCWEDALVDDFIAMEYLIINESTAPLFDVYVGFYADCDIGVRDAEQIAEDDYAGFSETIAEAQLGATTKNVKISIGYMWDDDGDEGASEGYIGLMFLGAQAPGSGGVPEFVSLRNFRMFSGTTSYDQGGDPTNDEERYAILNGTAPKSLPVVPEGALRPPQVAKKKDDYRIVVSAGPFNLEVGDSLRFQSALVVGRGYEGMMANAIQAQLTFDGVYLDCDENPLTGMDGRETRVCDPLPPGTPNPVRINPCDSICDTELPSNLACYAQVPPGGCVYINADCEYEEFTNQVTGDEGKECLVHWLIGTAPPPPRMRLHASENRVDVMWDNFSEITPDLRINVIDFESYRVWRADNWTRPFGTDVFTGPGAGLWMLMAEYDLPQNNIGSDVGLESIRYVPSIPQEAIHFYAEWFEHHPNLEPPDLPGFTEAEVDTAKSLATGVVYYRFVDPPLINGGVTAGPCPPERVCPPIVRSDGSVVSARCNEDGVCQESAPAPHSGQHYFYGVTATDHKLRLDEATLTWEIVGPGLAGDPSSNFVYINPPTNALEPARYETASDEIYVVPNPATPESMEPWTLNPNDEDPTGVKVEFHHLPQARGTVTVYTVAGDMVVELPFDGTSGNGSLAWDLLSRNGQEVTSGVYMFAVQADGGFQRFVGRFVVIR